jgi:hypothetical protein
MKRQCSRTGSRASNTADRQVQPSARIASHSMSSVPGRTLQRVRRLLPPPALARAGNQGDIDLQSIAGATATATHGTGARFANLSARIVALRLVTATGDVLTVSEGSEDYLAARVSPGALRVVSQVTLQTVPLYTLIRRGERRALTKTLERLDEFVDDNDHFDFFLFPYGETALTRTTCHTYEELTPTPLEVRFSAPDDAFLSTAHGRDTCYIAVHHTAGWNSKPTSVPSRRSWTMMRAGHIGANVIIRPPARCANAIPNGTASAPYAIGSTPTASLSTTTPGACSATDRHRPDTYQHDHKHIPKSVVL